MKFQSLMKSTADPYIWRYLAYNPIFAVYFFRIFPWIGSEISEICVFQLPSKVLRIYAYSFGDYIIIKDSYDLNFKNVIRLEKCFWYFQHAGKWKLLNAVTSWTFKPLFNSGSILWSMQTSFLCVCLWFRKCLALYRRFTYNRKEMVGGNFF